MLFALSLALSYLLVKLNIFFFGVYKMETGKNSRSFLKLRINDATAPSPLTFDKTYNLPLG